MSSSLSTSSSASCSSSSSSVSVFSSTPVNCRRLLVEYITKGNIDGACKLIETDKSSIEVRDSSQKTPLIVATINGSLEMVTLLLKHGAVVNCSTNKSTGSWSPLHIAAKNNYFKIVDFLLQNGANPDIRNAFGSTPLIEAAKCGHTHVIALLHRFNANAKLVDNEGFSAQYYAKKAGFAEIASRLPVVEYDYWSRLKSTSDFKTQIEDFKISLKKLKKKKKIITKKNNTMTMTKKF
eukprot:TRINITY_DN11991_c0_g1_i1.p1 TRINITY_DN11991_c0_g1~~TRINITY_DN11991_c0_g1_i1.p1  ORF type:complete len:237 (+),score=72.23 TRINITY_DN11991_c0_g1_i1:109-819(+)